MTGKYNEKKYRNDASIINYIEKNGVNLLNPDLDINSKKYLLTKILNYKGLRIGPDNSGAAFTPIEQCSNGKITEVVRDAYNRAKTRIQKLNKGQLRIEDDEHDGGLEKRTNQQPKQLSFGF